MRDRFATFLIAMAILALAWGAPEAVAQTGTALQRTTGTLSGTLTGASGEALAGVKVKVFEEGFVLAETESGSDGRYRLEFDYLPDIDWTVMVWFVPPDGNLIPEIVILRESLKSKDMELWSSCLPRIELAPRMKFDGKLVSEEEKLDQMSELDCMKNQGQ